MNFFINKKLFLLKENTQVNKKKFRSNGEKMNVLYIIFSFTVGGIEKLLVDMINYQAAEGKNKVYLCVINNHYDKELLDQIDSSVKVVLLNRPKGGKKIKYISEYTKFALSNDIDVVHCQGINAVKFSIPLKLLKPKVKIFNTIHDVREYLLMSKKEVLIDKYICKKIIAISDSVKSEILSRGIDKNKVIKIYNAINLNKFKSDSLKIFDKENIILGNVARLMPEKKGQDLLIQAVSKLKKKYPKIKCILAGDPAGGDKSILDNLKALTSKYDVEENIVFTGNVSDVPSLLKQIDIFIMPSRFEGFGISLIEAMAMGKPCIASDIDGPKEIIKENKYGILFKTGDYEDLVIKLEDMIENIELYDSEKTIRYVKDNFSITEMMKKINQVYSSN